MLKFHVSLAALIFLTYSFLAYSQDVKQAGKGPDEITLKSSAGNVLLPHKVHVKDVKLKCPVCHHQIRAAELDTPHPDYFTSSQVNCQTCHASPTEKRKKYYKCSDCHHSAPENIADETLSSKVVIHKSCWKCHETGTGVEASKGCSDCHAKEE